MSNPIQECREAHKNIPKQWYKMQGIYPWIFHSKKHNTYGIRFYKESECVHPGFVYKSKYDGDFVAIEKL